MKLFRRASQFRKKDSRMSLFPVELWIIILTEALRPPFSLDTYCFSSSMERYHESIAGDTFTSGRRDEHLITRRLLRLVCKHFNNIIKMIPKPPLFGWILEDDNEPRTYRAPVPHWSASGDWERIDLRLDFERSDTVTAFYTPVTIFRLFIRRKSVPHDPLDPTGSHQMGLIRDPTDVISHPNRLKVLHLQLEYCHCTQPPEFTQCIGTISYLTTLSLCLGTSNLRDIIYDPLSLPSLRVLFLKFPVFGTGNTALQLWTFVSLDILSLDLRIARSGVEPVSSMPNCISSFIQRHSRHLHGLRLQPGPWSAPRNDKYLRPMDPEAEQELWQQLPELKVLSADFTHFSMGSTHCRNTGESPFRSIVTLKQIGKLMSPDLLAGLAKAVVLCPVLQAVYMSSPLEEWRWEATMSQCGPNLLTLETICGRRNVSLYY